MLLDEALSLFLLSREQGTSGARKVNRPISLKNYKYDLEPFIVFMQERGINTYEALKKTDVMAFISGFDKKQNWSEATRLKVLRSLRAFFRWVERDDDCREEGLKPWYKALPAIPKTPRRKFVPERRSLKKFMSPMNTNTTVGMRDYVAMSVLLDTGIRVGELALLTVDGLKLEDRRLIVPELGKTGTRLVPLSKDVSRLLKGWLKIRERYAACDRVFPSMHSGQPATPHTFEQVFKRYRRKSGEKGITPHTLRHCFCTYFLEGGGDIAKLQAITGHSSLDMLKDYLHMSGKALEEEQERVSPLRQVKTTRL